MDVNKGNRLHLVVAKGHAIGLAAIALAAVGRILHGEE